MGLCAQCSPPIDGLFVKLAYLNASLAAQTGMLLVLEPLDEMADILSDLKT